MYGLQQIFDKTVDKQIREIQKGLLKKKFEELGIRLNKKQMAVALAADNGMYELDLNPKQVRAARKATGEHSLDPISIEITDAEIDEAKNKFSDTLCKAIPQATDETADYLIRKLKRRAREEVGTFAKEERRFERLLMKRWRRPLQLMEVYAAIIKEAAERFHFEYGPAEEEDDLVYDVIIKLHARARHIASEIITLLKSGFADGAHARWRTLHEVVVVALFIQKHGGDIAEKYILHESVETCKAAEQFQQYSKAMGHKPFSKRTMNRFRADYASVVSRFGRSFKTQYGWASVALSNQNPKFADLEKDVGLDKLRPYYRMASHNIHATTKGITHKLGLLPWFDVLMLDRSDIGLADPLHGTAISLLQITSTFMSMKPTIDTITLNTVLTKLQRVIGEESLKSQTAVQDYHEREWANLLSDCEILDPSDAKRGAESVAR